jgi:chitinase
VAQDVIGKRTATSQVYDFKFDFNMELAKRDTDTPTTFRIDICNLPTYWNSIVDAPGIQSRDLNNLETRYFAPTASTWQEKMVEYYDTFGVDNSFEQTINEDLTRGQGPLLGNDFHGPV